MKKVKDSSVQDGKRRWRISRRQFLIGAGVAGGTLALGVAFGLPYGRLKLAEMIDSGGGGFFSMPDDPWAWFEVAGDGRIRLYVSKVEMGQGVHTALKQVAAEELGISWTALDVLQGSTAVGPQDSTGTNGSTSVSSTFTPLRQAAATLREILRQEAAVQLAQSADKLEIQDDGFVVTGSDQRIGFGEIVSNKVGEWEVPEEAVPLKPVRDFKLVGQPVSRVDIPAKVDGTAVYGYDVKLPGMKFGAVLRPPTIEGRLRRVDTTTAAAMPGVVKIVEDGDFIGVVADSRPQAWAALDAIEAEWDEGKLWQQAELEEIVTVGGLGGVVVQKEGSPGMALFGGDNLTADYRTPFAVQTPLEAQAALADVGPYRARVWASTQSHESTGDQIAAALGLDAAVVEVIPTYLGGGFGRKLGDVAIEAARLSQAAGVPVHLGWNRREELRSGFFQPLSHHRMAAVLDGNGRITAMEHKLASGDILFSFFPDVMAAVFGADIGVTRGARIVYDIPNLRTEVWRCELPVKTGSWRGLGLLPNIFAIESFMDELAHTAGVDPLQFRLNHLGDDERGRRLRAVLAAVAERADWGGAVGNGRAQGLAITLDAETAVAAAAEVSVSDEGQVRVHKLTMGMDCGLVINPDGAKAQMEGNTMWGVSAALKEEVTIKDGQIDLNNFETYPLLTMREAPQVDAFLVDTGQTEPYGVGEPPIGPIAAAIANGIFALTGKRLRQIPFTAARVLAA
ncbi:MAG: xanthine dehydrogenase family protein molybdopterin-binding subunit [Ardenticatenaceae bacterium]|nr:xanthine dehydrogenase family protein molybdopterin-binding subunit [Ardenticatenaceae bacterium]MCB9445435.1 xanthine dehydrogenase family protein molybdopterin-binding subunit [Ardenticatenaceae bacterium]